MPELIIEFPFMPPAVLRGNARPGHWAQRAAATREFKDAAVWRLREANAYAGFPLFTPPIQITYRVFYCGKPIDRDNLLQGMKPIQDTLVAEFQKSIPDDSPEFVATPIVEYTRVAHRDQVRVVMEIASGCHKKRTARQDHYPRRLY